ncbi:hypothetical protein D3C86_1222500 [compost metagenome]
MSSARMASTAPASRRLTFRACCRLERKPVTTISSTVVASGSAAAGWASWAKAGAAPQIRAVAETPAMHRVRAWLKGRSMFLSPHRRQWHRCHLLVWCRA